MKNRIHMIALIKITMPNIQQNSFTKSHLTTFQLTSIFLLLLWNSVPNVESRVSGHYENFCTDNTDCNIEVGLTCQNQRCRCAAGGETVFSISKNRCVGAAGRECLRTENGTLCVDNSICRDYNYMFLCVCSDGYYQSRDGNCYKTAHFGESCREEDYACGDSVTTSISCVDKKCSCLLGENQYYDPLEGRCISHAGSQCLFHYPNPCSKNSYCGEVAENINGASFVTGHRCLCQAGYSYTRNTKCMARFGRRCSSDNPCNYDENLGCLNGICQCRNPLSEILDEKSGHCKIMVGALCNPELGPKCITNAECVPAKQNGRNSTQRTLHKCECSSGYSATPLGTCLLDINQKCEPQTCNHYNALTCVNETCACVDSSLTYDKSSKVCVAMIGQPCGHIQTHYKSNHDLESNDVVVFCEENAICSKSQAYSGIAGNSSLMKRVCKSTGGSSNASPKTNNN